MIPPSLLPGWVLYIRWTVIVAAVKLCPLSRTSGPFCRQFVFPAFFPVYGSLSCFLLVS